MYGVPVIESSQREFANNTPMEKGKRIGGLSLNHGVISEACKRG